MNYFAGYHHYAIQEHNERLRREMSTLRLEKRLRENRKPQSTRSFAFISRRLLAPLRHPRGAAYRALRTAPHEQRRTTRASL